MAGYHPGANEMKAENRDATWPDGHGCELGCTVGSECGPYLCRWLVNQPDTYQGVALQTRHSEWPQPANVPM